MLVGAAAPEQFAPCSGRRHCRALHHLALVGGDDILKAHLRARPTWRRSGTAEVIVTVLDFNRSLRTEAATTPPMRLIDTDQPTRGQSVAHDPDPDPPALTAADRTAGASAAVRTMRHTAAATKRPPEWTTRTGSA